MRNLTPNAELSRPDGAGLERLVLPARSDRGRSGSSAFSRREAPGERKGKGSPAFGRSLFTAGLGGDDAEKGKP